MKKNIVIIDTIWLGHHPTYFKLFCSLAIKSGLKVFALCPREHELLTWRNTNNYCSEQIEVYAFESKKRSSNFFFFGSLFSTYAQWSQLAKKIRVIESETRISVDLVFFPWLDNYLFPFIASSVHKMIFPYLWSGIYFHPYYLRKKFDKLSTLIHLSRLNIFRSKKNSNYTIKLSKLYFKYIIFSK